VVVLLGGGAWLVIVCELVRTGVEVWAAELLVPAEPPRVSATATATPSTAAARTNTAIQNPVVVLRGFAGGAGGTGGAGEVEAVRARFGGSRCGG
jgi:hypothetical protein